MGPGLEGAAAGSAHVTTGAVVCQVLVTLALALAVWAVTRWFLSSEQLGRVTGDPPPPYPLDRALVRHEFPDHDCAACAALAALISQERVRHEFLDELISQKRRER